MTVLGAPDRQLVFSGVNQDPVCVQGLPITKAELKAASDAIDDWVDANSSGFNTAIPQPARSALSARQKAAIFVRVLLRRFEVS
jgi:hypothetical protein